MNATRTNSSHATRLGETGTAQQIIDLLDSTAE
jgi:hypothetical protein